MEVDYVNINGHNEVDHEIPPHPRVGEQYQIELPSLMSKFDYCMFEKNSHDGERSCTSHEALIGSSIPIICIKCKEEKYKCEQIKHECKSKGDANGSMLLNGMDLRVSRNFNVQQEANIEVHEKNKWNGHCLVHEPLSDNWNEREKASFILGLYIFGKDFDKVKRFIDNKTMGDILVFYYMKFYKTDKYKRWSKCKKSVKSKKCIYGSKIFTGPSQQELLSRLLLNVPKECHGKLLKVSETYADGKMPLEDYVSTLKASVGLIALVEAIGIETEKDLTGFPANSMRSLQVVPVCPKISVGEAWATLTPMEIINFLKGDFRLSKSRANDIFWGAVWPRLLAKGWHSEQLYGNKYVATCKRRLVFLIPGVERFSSELKMGNQYFDSIKDVLDKVASNLELIELDTTIDNGNTSKEENMCIGKTNVKQDNYIDQLHHCNLELQTPNFGTDVNEFIVVDTSIGSERVKELRRFPDEVMKACAFKDGSDNGGTSKEHIKEYDFVDILCMDKGKTSGTNASESIISKKVSYGVNVPLKKVLPKKGMHSTNPSSTSKDQRTKIRDAMKLESIQNLVLDGKNVVVSPDAKRQRRLNITSPLERDFNNASLFMVPLEKQEVASFSANNSKPVENVIPNNFVAPNVNQVKCKLNLLVSKFSEHDVSQETPPEEKTLPVFLHPQEYKTLEDSRSITGSIINEEVVLGTSSFGIKDQYEKNQPRIFIDLNLPVPEPRITIDLNLVAPLEDEKYEHFVPEVVDKQQNNIGEESDETISKAMNHSKQQLDMNIRRRSTRIPKPSQKILHFWATEDL